nr:hypothetical protein [Streptomyces asoensis]
MGLTARSGHLGHFAVSDLTRGTFQYAGTPDSYPVPDTPGEFAR